MSKLKLSFSFFLTLLLVGMFSVVAFAAAPDAPTGVKWTDDGTSITVRWQAVSGATSYKIYVDGTAQVPVTTNTGTVIGLAEKTTYGIEVTAINADGESARTTLVSAKTGTGAPTHNSTLTNGLAYNDSDLDNGIINNNQTGSGAGGQTANFNQVIKSDNMVTKDGSHGTQRTHGEYMNNTNSCASCHQTHTGASESLLFKDGRYQTCTACHDGTLGFYNVFTGSDSAGKFGGTHDGNMSVHLANGTVALKAAPGGNKDAADGSSWTEEFSCASCHAPHGSYSSRLLNENPNEMGNTLVKDGGKRLEDVPVVDANFVVNATTGDKFSLTTKVASADKTYTDATGTVVTYNYVLYRFQLGATGAPTNKKQVYNSGTKKWVDSSNPADDNYLTKGLKDGDTVLQLMKWNGTKYVVDTDPWLHGYDFDAAHVNKIYWTKFLDSSNNTIFDTDQLKKGEILGSGFAAVPSGNALVSTVNSIVKGNIARGYVVKLDVGPLDSNNVATTTVSSLWASKFADGSINPGYYPNRGVAMSGFCAACHTDYLASSGKETGTFDHAYRHTTTSDSYTCVRCHYAHGTDVTIMRDARGKTYNDILKGINGGENYFTSTPYVDGGDNSARETLVKDYLIDKNPSSSLKRYTNMAVCWACHTSSHSEGTRNTDSYQYDPNAGINTDRNGIEFDY